MFNKKKKKEWPPMTAYDPHFLWKRLFAGGPLANKKLFSGGPPAYKNLFDGGSSANKKLFAGALSLLFSPEWS